MFVFNFPIGTIENALTQMIQKADEIGVDCGTAQITLRVNHKQDTVSFTSNNNTNVRIGVAGKLDVNYSAVVAAKVAQMLRTMNDSGADDGLIGEVPYRGGVIIASNNLIFFIAYSGGTEDEDVIISKAGLEHINNNS